MVKDVEVEKLAKDYRYETDEELKRKREVFRSNIVSSTLDQIAESAGDTEKNEAKYEVLSKIIRRRERQKHRREALKEVILWSGLLGPFAVGTFTRELLPVVMRWVETILPGSGTGI